ncbi:MAG: alpha/beta hydrolase [Terriglobales bacterium]
MGQPPPPPGRLWSVNGHRLHGQARPAAAAAAAAPTVVFEAALGGTSLSWHLVQPAVAELAPTLSYDRAGLGWSEAGPMPRSLPGLVAELQALLAATSTSAPLVLVGHSFGALIVRHFAAVYPELVAGLVLVDPPALEEWAHPDAAHRERLERGVRLARRGALAARCGVAQIAAALVHLGALGPASAIATAISGGKLRAARDFNFTPALRLPDAMKPALRWFWTRPRFYEALASQMEMLPEAARLVEAAPALSALPLAVLSAADTPPLQRREHEGVAGQSRRGQHHVARAAGHWIPLEEPELVIETVRSVLEAAAASY